MYWCIQMKIDNRGMTYIELMVSSLIVTSILCVFVTGITNNNKIFASIQDSDKLTKSANEIINIICSTGSMSGIKDLYIDDFDYVIGIYNVSGNPEIIRIEHLSISYFDTTNASISSSDLTDILQKDTFKVYGTLDIFNQFLIFNVSHKDYGIESGVQYVVAY